MRAISNEFRKAIQSGGPFYAYAVITLMNGTQLHLNSQDDFFITGNKYDHSFSSAFPMGEAACKVLDLGINNSQDKYSLHDFDGAKIVLYTEVDTVNAVSRMQEGVFEVTDSKSNGDIIELSASDNMHKTDIDMPTVTYPATLREIVNAICTKCGIVLSTVYFNNWDYRVTVAPPEMTCREMLGYVAQVAGGNALIDYTGKLIFKAYAKGQYESSHIVTGGNLGDNTSDVLSGGVFGDDLDTSILGGELDTDTDYILLSNYTTDPEIATDDIVITGVSYDYKRNKVTYTEMYGTEGYVLKLENPLIAGQISVGVRLIGTRIVGMKVRPFSGNFSPNPCIELMDTVYVVDRKGNIYQSFVTSNTFEYLGYSNIANETESPEQNKVKYKSNASAVYRQVQADIAEERTDWENAVEQLNEDLANASGLYETAEVQPDQSTIYYFHDKSTLTDSQIVIKITSQALAISTDGGQTYPTGITVDGNAVIAILQSAGINADWITSGTLKVGGTNNIDGQVDIYDSNNQICGTINNSGISVFGGAEISVGLGNNYIDTLSSSIIFKNSTDTKTLSNSLDKLTLKQNSGSGDISVFEISSTLFSIYKRLFVTAGIDVSMGINMNNSDLTNVNFTGTVKSGGDSTYTGTVNFIKSIQNNGDGTITWYNGTMTIKNGLITNVV